MSPRTVPCRTRSVTSTGPSMEPVSLTDKEAGDLGSARTPPATWPSRCRPPANSTSPFTRTDLAISVSIRGGLESRLNMDLGSLRALRHGHGAPGKCLLQWRDILAAGADLDRQMLGAEIERQDDGLLEVLEVAEVVRDVGSAAGSERLTVQCHRLASGALAVHCQANAPGSHAISLAGPHQGHVHQEVAGRLGGGQAHRPDPDADRRGALCDHSAIER